MATSPLQSGGDVLARRLHAEREHAVVGRGARHEVAEPVRPQRVRRRVDPDDRPPSPSAAQRAPSAYVELREDAPSLMLLTTCPCSATSTPVAGVTAAQT